jgi:subtilisin family serine protease
VDYENKRCNSNNFSSLPANLPNVIAVGAMSPCGERRFTFSCDGESWWGSNYGGALDIVAPGVIISTTDRQSNEGYNHSANQNDYPNRDYIERFNGTSAAAPHVAGVAALVLSVNPSLTGQQVRDIIESTAQKVRPDLYTYSTTSGHPNGTWNNEMGYGLVDAYAAVRAACATPVVNFTNQNITTNTTVTNNCGDINVQNVNVQNGAKLTIDAGGEVTINGDFEVQLGSELEIK